MAMGNLDIKFQRFVPPSLRPRHLTVTEQFFKTGIEERLFAHPSFQSHPCRAIEAIVRRLEFEIRCRRDLDTRFSGTTLAMAIIQESRLISVNIGDSRIVLGCRDQNGQIISRALTKDYSLDDPQEHAWITASGGRIFRTVSSSCSSKSSSGKRRNLHWGPVRVWLPDIDAPGLAMSRSLCDDVIHSVGVTSTLEFHEHLFDHTKDCLLIIATDGVWQYLSNQEAVDIAIDESEPSKASIRSIHPLPSSWLPLTAPQTH